MPLFRFISLRRAAGMALFQISSAADMPGFISIMIVSKSSRNLNDALAPTEAWRRNGAGHARLKRRALRSIA